MGMPVSNGNINQGDLCAVVADDTICRYETISSNGKLNLRKLSDNLLLNKTPAETRIVTATEYATYGTDLALANAQSVYDAASTALTAAGGTPCP